MHYSRMSEVCSILTILSTCSAHLSANVLTKFPLKYWQRKQYAFPKHVIFRFSYNSIWVYAVLDSVCVKLARLTNFLFPLKRIISTICVPTFIKNSSSKLNQPVSLWTPCAPLPLQPERIEKKTRSPPAKFKIRHRGCGLGKMQLFPFKLAGGRQPMKRRAEARAH